MKRRVLLCLAVSSAAWARDGAEVPADNSIESRSMIQLLEVKRLYVEKLSGGETAVQIRDMIIAGLQNARLFVVTENPEMADAILRGSGEDLIFTDTFQTSQGLRANASIGSRSTSTKSTSSLPRSASVGISDNESSRIAERKHEAVASVRLVTRDGDVIWSTTQESLGGKFRGASADVAYKVTQQLESDFARARKALAVLPPRK